MIYTYDLLVNLNYEMYDFYDWTDNDNVIHIRRCPLIKLLDKDYINICFKKIRMSLEFLELIKDKCQMFKTNKVELLNYACIFTNGVNSFMALFDKSGLIIKKSKFLISEELEINELSKKLKVVNVKYNVINNKFRFNKMLREEIDKIELILRNLESIKESKEKIDYLYFEWFNKNNSDNKYEELIKDIKSKYTTKHSELLEILNLIKIEK